MSLQEEYSVFGTHSLKKVSCRSFYGLCGMGSGTGLMILWSSKFLWSLIFGEFTKGIPSL